MKRARKLCVALAIGAIAVATAPSAAWAGDAQPEAINYVAMGDSFASGAGAGNYADVAEVAPTSWKGGDCLQSANGYSPLLAAELGATLDFQSCSGAQTADIHADQLGTISAATDLITLSVGGNDVGFADVIQTCTFNGTATCTSKVTEAENKARSVLPGRLGTLYSAIKQKAPNAQVIVLGYPQLFIGKTCFGNTGVNLDEQARINQANYVLNGIIKTAATSAGFTYVDTMPPFVGKGVCASGAWINGLKFNLAEAYHPNGNGHRLGYLPLILAKVNQLSLTTA
ncbi:SGNH/GDSL hydrolase family protein [Stackebrandtia soli]|uniref:SGNH/GDSL hydrolase family protein n=1 Tax=Stackebrandtia soli TaxID=1892856 RepID=UPI0039EC0D51